ncbi:MAG: 16S rRNA (adenine(1518)-N(6)/adenine(1519)-N(6))-dimethyltransferase [Magnetococcales bacterium]|mgnify:CR=1 FL=1|nr:16S rRNA (adenine(1518)-N(6)/adenine(1519)-N(6))-dimethyltransferase [Magnetococcales bacterium]|tara:strand:+ start:8842 stop:9630 length:789 start_codon:yes stop_codon:yes gene_type:complete
MEKITSSLEVSAKKSLGQNFLVDQNIIRKIIQAINPQAGEYIVEIGPGQGALTEHLLAAGAHVIALEKDTRMVEPLQKLSAKYDNRLRVVLGDALEQDLTQLSDQPLKLVGNLPYNVGTQMVFNALKLGSHIKGMTFMLQKEVVQRITANPQNNHWGRLAVWCDLYTQRQKLFDVPPTAFHPRPKVTSAIVSLTPRADKKHQVDDTKLERVLNKSFTQRRKMLRASLKGTLSIEQIESIGIQATQRPETLTTEEFCKLAHLL